MPKELVDTDIFLPKLEESEWIGGAGNKFCRKDFVLLEKPKQARLFIIADKHKYKKINSWMLENSFLKYRLFINEKQFGAGPFRPVIDTIPVLHSFDLTTLLNKGNNVLGCISRGAEKGFALFLEISFSDGKQFLIRSDNSWKIFDADQVYNHYTSSSDNNGEIGPGELAEHIDGTKYPDGWLKTDYNDINWEKAQTYGKCLEQYEIYDGVNYKLDKLKPQSVKKLGEGHFLVDFGQELIAGIKLGSSGFLGKVEIRLGEELYSNGRVRYKMRTGNHYQETWIFAKGNDFLENFSLHAFRYAEIIISEGSFDIDKIQAVTVGIPFSETDSIFKCSNEKLEQVWRFCKQTIKTSNLDVYMDCPSRERIAYEGDSYINMLSHFFVESNYPMARRSFEYQLMHPTWPCEWRQFVIPLAYEYLMHSGDLDTVDRYFDFMCNNCSFHNLIENGLVENFPMRIIIDWPACYRDNYEFGKNCAVPNAFAYYNLILLAKLAKLLNRTSGKIFSKLASQVKTAFNNLLYDDSVGLYRDNSESSHCSFHANMFALCFDLVPKDRIPNCIEFIAKKGMICSVYAAQFYLETLFKYDYDKLAVKLMTHNDQYSSWLGMIAQGATVTMEAWHPDHKPNLSFAHPWATAPANIIPRCLFGVEPLEPGWGKFSFAPKPGGLKNAKLTIPTPKGELTVAFKRKGNNYELFKKLKV